MLRRLGVAHALPPAVWNASRVAPWALLGGGLLAVGLGNTCCGWPRPPPPPVHSNSNSNSHEYPPAPLWGHQAVEGAAFSHQAVVFQAV